MNLIVGQPFRVAFQARLKPCPTNHPMGERKPQAKACGYRSLSKKSLNLGRSRLNNWEVSPLLCWLHALSSITHSQTESPRGLALTRVELSFGLIAFAKPFHQYWE